MGFLSGVLQGEPVRVSGGTVAGDQGFGDEQFLRYDGAGGEGEGGGFGLS